jgi:hypothetical protein
VQWLTQVPTPCVRACSQIKYLADPSMHAISSAVLDPKGKFWLGQSADNQVSESWIFGFGCLVQQPGRFWGHGSWVECLIGS